MSPSTKDVDFELKPSSVTEKNAAEDVFGDEADHEIQYKTLSWQFVAAIMIAEIVSNGMLTLPNAMAVVGIVPSLVLTIFLGVFALYTAKLLIDFKMNHPEVHNMGDAGYIIFGPIGREILSGGTIIFAVFAIGSEILSGQLALSVLSNNGLCATALLAIFAVATFLLSLPRTLGGLTWLGLLSAVFITICGILAMIGAGVNPIADRVVVAAVPTTFYEAFLAITGPVFSYAGKMKTSTSKFFILISEMKKPEDAMKAAWVLQGFSTIFYVIFSVVIYVYIGSTVASSALLSLPPVWSKITFAIGMINFLMQVPSFKPTVLSVLMLRSSGALYGHTAAKLVFFRFFRYSRHVHSHTPLGWAVWITLCFAATAAAFLLATGVPIFSYLTGITASLFASWYTYGIAGFFWLHDTFYLKGGSHALRRRWVGTTMASSTVLAGAFICVAGTYVSIKLIADAYRDGLVGRPFTC
ncbi:transmembrane amino acid transporter protein-domain-containing protein [Trametes maxima]|nr:transmembrane amino acid transporter protein-domain-containing protein [Trametes maxima]